MKNGSTCVNDTYTVCEMCDIFSFFLHIAKEKKVFPFILRSWLEETSRLCNQNLQEFNECHGKSKIVEINFYMFADFLVNASSNS